MFAVFLAAPRDGTHKTQLLSVTPAPFAEHKMKPQPDSPEQRELVIEYFRLQATGFFATGRKRANHSTESFNQVQKPIHFLAATRRHDTGYLSWRSGKPYKVPEEFFLLVLCAAQSLQRALPCLGGQTFVGQLEHRLIKTRRGVVKKFQLLEIPFAPHTNQKVQPHLQPHFQRKRLFQRLRSEM